MNTPLMTISRYESRPAAAVEENRDDRNDAAQRADREPPEHPPVSAGSGRAGKNRGLPRGGPAGPSAENDQGWRFLVIDDPELKARFARKAFSGIYAPTRFAAEAPVLVLLLSKIENVGLRTGQHIQGIPYYALDAGIAGEHFVLQAEELGLGDVLDRLVRCPGSSALFKIPRRYKIVSLIAAGYAARRPPHERVRKSMDEIAWWNRFGE